MSQRDGVMKLNSKTLILTLGVFIVGCVSLTAFALSKPKGVSVQSKSSSVAKTSRKAKPQAQRAAKQPKQKQKQKHAKANKGGKKLKAAKKLPAPIVFAGEMPLPDRNPVRPKSSSVAMDTPPLPDRAPQPSKYAAALSPLLNYSLSESDKANLKDAIRAGYRKDYAGVVAAKAKLKDAGARKLALWYAYRIGAPNASGVEIERFRVGNPYWPDQEKLRHNAETNLLFSPPSPDEVIAFFKDSMPETGAGKAALASAVLAKGQKSRAHSLIVSAWRDHAFDESVEKKILALFPSILTADDHKVRIDRLLYADKKIQTGPALRVAKLLGADEQKKVEARVAVVQRSAKAGKMLDGLPKEALKADVGLFFNRIQWLRRSDREAEAWQALLEAPNEPEKLVDIKEWWTERQIHCRTALNAGHPAVAYEIAANHGPLSGTPYREAEFLAGWIALRFLDRVPDALAHFQALRTASDDPKWIATASYWLGRTAKAMGDKPSATQHFSEAALYAQFYYGQLAAQEIAGGPTSLVLTPTPEASEADIQRFMALDAVKATAILRQAGLDNLVPVFLYQLSRSLERPVDSVLTAELSRMYRDRQATVRLAKIAFNRGMPVAAYAFPSDVLPQYETLNAGVESSLVHALTRQESEFNVNARSPVGARGLMQFMPATARAVAKKYSRPYSEGKLTDAAYNVALGNAHLRDLVDEFNGSYILALVSYNAGPGRARQWSREFGDPTNQGVDPIDWVERIPFSETREYVKKISESLQVYRSRIEGPAQALRLNEDLHRGHPALAKAGAETASVD